MGKTPLRKETEYWSNGTIPWVSIADLVADGTVTITKECVNHYAAEHIFKGKVSKAGTLLMSFKLTVGKVSISEVGLNQPALNAAFKDAHTEPPNPDEEIAALIPIRLIR